MTDLQIGILGIVVLLILMFSGMRIAYAVSLVGTLGIVLIKGFGPAISLIGSIPGNVVGMYSYSAIPLFILMGYFAYTAGITDNLFETAKAWVQHIRGGLPVATVLASAGFATVSGASTASSLVLGKITIPQMLKNGVDPRLAAGTVAMSGTLAALIPPSTIIIIYGILTEQSISSMLIAGIIPGVFSVIAYILLIYIRSRLSSGGGETPQKLPLMERIKSLKKTFGMLILIIVVIGGIYMGFFTPTEAAAIGALGSFVLSIRNMTMAKIQESIIETVKVSTMIFAILVGISIFIRFLAHSGITKTLNSYVLSLSIPPLTIIFAMLFVYLLLGMFMDGVSMMMLTLPVFFPLIVSLGFNLIWFGIIVVKMAEIGMVTPPVGLNCFMVKRAAPDIPMGTIFRGVTPFIVVDMAVILFLIFVPEVVTFLPDLMKN